MSQIFRNMLTSFNGSSTVGGQKELSKNALDADPTTLDGDAINGNDQVRGAKRSGAGNRLMGKMIGRFQSVSMANGRCKNGLFHCNNNQSKTIQELDESKSLGELVKTIECEEEIALNDNDEDEDVEEDDDKENVALPEELCDLPSFLETKNCDSSLIEETRRLLRERYAKNPDSFYDHDYQRMLTDDWTVTRFLLRRRLDPKRTAKLMEECGLFRKLYKMSEVKLWEFPIEFHQVGGLFHYEPDKVGNRTVYMRTRMYRRVPELSDVFKAFVLCVLEEADCANEGRGVAVIFDLTGCGLQNVDLGFLSWLLSSFRNYCPKGVSYIMVYNLPWFLNATAKLAMGWLSSSNRRALRFVHGNEIESFIARENLPDYLGGTCKRDYRAIPEGSRRAVEVCDRLEMSPEQALKIRDMFTQYLPEEEQDQAIQQQQQQATMLASKAVMMQDLDEVDDDEEFLDCELPQVQHKQQHSQSPAVKLVKLSIRNLSKRKRKDKQTK